MKMREKLTHGLVFTSLEPKADEVRLYDGTGACFRSVNTFEHKYLFETSSRITIKIHPEHHCGGRKATIGFGPVWIKTLDSMARISSLKVTLF